MTIPEKLIYPRTGDKATIYLKNVISSPNIMVGDYTMYNDFVQDPVLFEKNNVLYHYPINHDKLVIGKFCSIASDETVSELLEIKWWDWPKEKIADNIEAIKSGSIEKLR